MELYAHIRDDWQLNQFIVNRLLNSDNIINLDFPSNMQNNNLSHQSWSFYQGFIKNYKSIHPYSLSITYITLKYFEK